MCDFGDLDPCSVWVETPRKARKPHQCDGCGAVVQPGEAYIDHRDVFEGTAHTEACCFACWLARAQFAEAHESMFAPSALWSALQDCIGENDDPEDLWRPVFATLKRRYRISPAGRISLHRKWREPTRVWPNTQARTTPPEEWELSR